MGLMLPTGSKHHITLTIEQGLVQRHRTLRECVAAGVYQIGVGRVAAKVDESSSKLSEKLSGGTPDRPRDVGCDLLERYIKETGDFTPIYWLIERFLQDADTLHQQALAQLISLADQLPTLLKTLGAAPSNSRL